MSIVNFLRLHPATELWWTRRSRCESCANLQLGSGMRCKVTPAPRANGQRELLYCIDAREEGQPCGPDARLFKE